jgi:hypothetical protein
MMGIAHPAWNCLQNRPESKNSSNFTKVDIYQGGFFLKWTQNCGLDSLEIPFLGLSKV